MTLRTSAVADCCCRDSRSSVSNRAFSTAITACSEDGDQFDLLIGKWAYLVAAKRKGANRLPVAQKRHSKDRPVPERLLIVHRVVFGIG
jgi:hypothetical protein